MPGTLPVPLEIELPQGWESAPPDKVGAPHAAFVALHKASQGQGFTPNITVTGHTIEGSPGLHRLAEESVQRLRENVGAVDIVKRTEVGTSSAPGLVDAPGIVQNLRIQAAVNEQPMELAQSQFILVLENEKQRSELVQIEVALTAKTSQLQDVLEDFQDFVAALRPATQT
ncbi:hypothetical protein DB35_22925 [Streptomyces abyssalis]|uniref:Uncharacterized protein n=1 Tax=Streptomyces abyssalis TaxID=933944 RepID=A0A1E7JP32_9ACTN|nr:hypothetical protein [Streptomyces abyssalis]OEU86570.1 hypothetical protein DB35_22925 [Streptomyces abyssalis]OEU90041.1 hypothetical protein AN215_10585 [Streptomyces abyssalis]OEV30472.1 hypothetical protein AN219_10785 [Streptomyces nanshensis]